MSQSLLWRDLSAVLRGVRAVADASLNLAKSDPCYRRAWEIVTSSPENPAVIITSAARSLARGEGSPDVTAAVDKTLFMAENATVLGAALARAAVKELVEENSEVDMNEWKDISRSGRAAKQSRKLRRAEEYELNSALSSLELLNQVELTDREAIRRVAFSPRVPESVERDQELSSVKPESSGSSTRVWERRKKLSSSSAERAVPSSRLKRMASFGSLGIGLGIGTVGEASKRILGLSDATWGSSLLLSDANAERMVRTLCRVRGAALKIGQILSIQDESFVSPQVAAIFERVRESADFMPRWQLEKVLDAELGPDWRARHFSSFEDRPFAAASIGQVHQGELKDGRTVAVKVQYPGVAEGIDSDISNLLGLLKVANVLPEGLFIDSVVQHMKVELAQECDYLREADCCRKMRDILAYNKNVYVPEVISTLSTKQVFTTELIEGLTIDQCIDLDQDTRNHITIVILDLLLRELFIFRYMQTDPNWANFLFNPDTGQLGLLDFGATREFRPFFVDNYFKIIEGSANDDRDAVLDYSKKVGFLTGYESQKMTNAHVESVMILGECFRSESSFDFGRQETTARMQELVPVMIAERLCPPPPEVYSLHRKMSGLFLLASKLRAKIKCQAVWKAVVHDYEKLAAASVQL